MFRRFLGFFKPTEENSYSKIDVENPDIKPQLPSVIPISEKQDLLTHVEKLQQLKAEILEMERAYEKSYFRWQASTLLGSLALTAVWGGAIGRLNHKFFNPYWEDNKLFYRNRFDFMALDDDGCTPASLGCVGYYPNFLNFGSKPLANCTQAGYSPLENLVCPDLYIRACLNIMDTMCDILNSTTYQYVDDETNRHNLNNAFGTLMTCSFITPLIGCLVVALLNEYKKKRPADLVPVSALQKDKLQDYISQIGSGIHLNISKKGFGNEYINSAELYSQIDREIALANARLVVNNIDQDKNNRASFFQPDKDEQQTGINLPDEAVYSA
ncbi:hypothetical protein [Legionella genomosp. 1]|uniref:hypothetical protein n=1 Tax=Legionella genomosp. 1 TaxID=1093625 RepID=UPI0010564A40|nr:hypothetical protein [Legionella genomosp. 1]